MLYEISALRDRQAEIHCLHEMLVIFKVTAERLLNKFVRSQAALGRDFRQLRFLFRLQTNIHGQSVGSSGESVK